MVVGRLALPCDEPCLVVALQSDPSPAVGLVEVTAVAGAVVAAVAGVAAAVEVVVLAAEIASYRMGIAVVVERLVDPCMWVRQETDLDSRVDRVVDGDRVVCVDAEVFERSRSNYS